MRHKQTLPMRFRSSRVEALESRRLMAADVAGAYAEFATIVKDVNTTRVNANANWSVAFNDSQYFLLSSEGGYNELWKTDGTADGTELVTQISRHPIDQRRDGCTCFDSTQVIDGDLYFVVMTGNTPLIDFWGGSAAVELWRTDGTADGTAKVRDIELEDAGQLRSGQFDLFDDHGEIGVIAHVGFDAERFEISSISGYQYDGVFQPSGVHFASLDLVQRDGATFFLAFEVDPFSSGTLWSFAGLYKADRTSNEIELVQELENRACAGRCTFNATNTGDLFTDWWGSSLAEVDGNIVITSNHDRFVYHSDGTSEGTVLVTNEEPKSTEVPSDYRSPFEPAAPVTDTFGTTPDGQVLHYDGGQIKGGDFLFDVPNNNEGDFPERILVASDGVNDIGVAYAQASLDGEARPEFRLSDGTAEGTNAITSADYATYWNRAADDATLARLDLVEGLPDRRLILGTAFVDDVLYVHTGTTDRHDLWAISADGELEWTSRISQLVKPMGKSSTLFSWNGSLYGVFAGRAAAMTLVELDLTSRRFQSVIQGGVEFDLPPYRAYRVFDLAATSDQLFVATNQNELWVIEAESGQPRKLEALASDFALGAYWGVTSSQLSHFGELGNTGLEIATWHDNLFFSRQTETGVQLWSSDGTEAGTELALDLGPTDTLPMALTVWDDKLFFAADDVVHGNELWVIDLAAQAAAQQQSVEPQADINSDGIVDFVDFLILSANFGSETDQGGAAGDFDNNGQVDFTDFLVLADAFGKPLAGS